MFFTTVQQTIQQAISSLMGKTSTSEGFSNVTANYFALLLTVFLWILLVLFVAEYLWNNVLVSLVPAVKPAKGMLQMLGLMILLQILMP
jgi:hypothetical protein